VVGEGQLNFENFWERNGVITNSGETRQVTEIEVMNVLSHAVHYGMDKNKSSSYRMLKTFLI